MDNPSRKSGFFIVTGDNFILLRPHKSDVKKINMIRIFLKSKMYAIVKIIKIIIKWVKKIVFNDEKAIVDISG